MNAVAESPRTKAPATPGKLAASRKQAKHQANSTEEAIKAAFGIVSALLEDACATDEPHAWSGDSDRLLRIAHDLSAEGHNNPPNSYEADRLAYDIAALIRAARLVPGDTESDERRVLIDQAAVQLNWLTGCDRAGSNCIESVVPRPSLPGAVSPSHHVESSIAARPGDSGPARELATSALCHVEAAKAVLDLWQDDDVSDEVYAVSRLMETLWEGCSDIDEVRDIGLPFLGSFSDFQRELCILIAIADLVRIKEDGLMCAVVYLLKDASRLMEEALVAIPKHTDEVSA